MNFKPMDDYLVVEQPPEAETVNGLHLPNTVDRRAYTAHEGNVLSVGPGRLLPNGDYRPLEIEVGDYVYWNPLAGAKVKVDGEEILILHVGDLYGSRVDVPRGTPALVAPELSESGV